MSFRCEIYSPKFKEKLDHYFEVARAEAPNNATANNLRLDKYDSIEGDLFLVVDDSDKIWGMSSVIVSRELACEAAKIYGRFHLMKGCPHSAIDSMLEPQSFLWIEQRGIKSVFLTINLGHERTLEWVSRRCGTRRGMSRKNPYGYTFGEKIRAGWIAYPKLILERGVWQYCIYYSEDGRFFLKRETRPLENIGRQIFSENFSNFETGLLGCTNV